MIRVTLLHAAIGYFILTPAMSQQASILLQPEAKTVALNTTGTASFNCIVAGHGIIFEWKINCESNDVSHLQQSGVYTSDERTGSMINSTLFIPATTEFNNSEVTCSVAGSNGTAESDPVTLKIQGLLGPPPNLRVEYCSSASDEYHSQLQWDAPFTLDITDVDPDISGYTICNNMMTECVIVTEEFIQFPRICTPTTFSVSARNTAGAGARAYFQYSLPTSVHNNISSQLSELNISVIFEGELVAIHFTLVQETNDCYHFYEIYLTSTYSTKNYSFGPILPNVTNDMAMIVITDVLPDNEIFDGNITTFIGDRIKDVHFRTFDVQKVHITNNTITCIFAKGSNAQGCYIRLVEGNTNPGFGVLRDINDDGFLLNSAFLVVNASGIYNVSVFDIESDGSFNISRRAYHKTAVSIIIDEPDSCKLTSSESGILLLAMWAVQVLL